jgi:MFS superfamily sulfate permease-like transporter
VIAVASPAANELRRVPVATLAAILIFVASRLVRVPDLKAIAHFSKVELGLATVTAVVVAFVGVEQGIALAVLLAVLDRARRSARPRVVELGRVPGTTSWTPIHGLEPCEAVPGVRVALFAGPLYFANAGEFRTRFNSLIAEPGALHAIVLDAAAMGDIDYTGATTLRTVVDELLARKIELVVARAGAEVMANLKASGILDRLGDSRIFETVDDAVRAVTKDAAAPATTTTPAAETAGEHR